MALLDGRSSAAAPFHVDQKRRGTCPAPRPTRCPCLVALVSTVTSIRRPDGVTTASNGARRSIREATAITYEGTAALAAQRRSSPGLVELERAVAALDEAVTDGTDNDIIAADREFLHTVAALTDSVALELSVTDFYRAFDASLDVAGGMKRSSASLLRAVGARSEPLPHRVLADGNASASSGRRGIPLMVMAD